MSGAGSTRHFATLVTVLALAGGIAWRSAAAQESTPQENAVRAMLDPSSGPQFAAGARIYREHCAACHDAGLGRAPLRIVLLQLAPETIRQVLTNGPMRTQAAGLSAQDKTAVAEYLSAQKVGTAAAPPPFVQCAGAAAKFNYGEPPVFDGLGLEPGNSHAIPDRVAGLDRGNVGRLRLNWAFAVPGATRLRSQPVLAGGALYFGSSTGEVFALDRASGCVRWSRPGTAEVRTAVLVEKWHAGDRHARPMAWYADITGNVRALDARTGALRWERKVTDHPAAGISATPALANGVLYVPMSSLEEASAADPRYPCCTFRGGIVALDARTGRELWRRYTVGEPRPLPGSADGIARFGPSGVAVWNTPAVDRKRGTLIFGTGNTYSGKDGPYSNAIVALDLRTGKVRWAKKLTKGDVWNVGCIFQGTNRNCPEDEGPDYDFGANTVVAASPAGDVVLAGQKSGLAFGLDPATGRVRWQTRLGRGGAAGGIHFGLAAYGGVAYVPVNDMPDPHATGFPLSPGLYALEVASGKRRWSAPNADVCNGVAGCLPGLGGGVSATSQLVMAGAVDGHMRIYDARDGSVLWDYASMHAYRGLGGIPGRGGAIAGAPAPIAWHGNLYFASGYGFAGRVPGNVMLAFTVR